MADLRRTYPFLRSFIVDIVPEGCIPTYDHGLFTTFYANEDGVATTGWGDRTIVPTVPMENEVELGIFFANFMRSLCMKTARFSKDTVPIEDRMVWANISTVSESVFCGPRDNIPPGWELCPQLHRGAVLTVKRMSPEECGDPIGCIPIDQGRYGIIIRDYPHHFSWFE